MILIRFLLSLVLLATLQVRSLVPTLSFSSSRIRAFRCLVRKSAEESIDNFEGRGTEGDLGDIIDVKPQFSDQENIIGDSVGDAVAGGSKRGRKSAKKIPLIEVSSPLDLRKRLCTTERKEGVDLTKLSGENMRKYTYLLDSTI